MTERVYSLGELAYTASYHSIKNITESAHSRKRALQAVYTGRFFVDADAVKKEIVIDEQRHWLTLQDGPINNLLFLASASPELTTSGQLRYGILTSGIFRALTDMETVIYPRSPQEKEIVDMLCEKMRAVYEYNKQVKKGKRKVTIFDASEDFKKK